MRVAFSGFFADSSGYGEMSRRYLHALLQAGADVTCGGLLADGGWMLPPAGQLKEFVSRMRIGAPDVHLLCVTGMDVGKVYPKDIARTVPRVGAMCWETDRLHPLTTEGCKTLDKIIVPSAQTGLVFDRAGFKTYVVPIPVEVPVYIDELPVKGLEDVAPETFLFYSMMTLQERKNPVGLLAAYCNAFTRFDNVVLALKINGPNTASATASAQQMINGLLNVIALEDAPKILLLGGEWSPQLLWALHYRGDCYVSLAKGESFGIPMLDAAAVGNRVISTGYGGQRDFLPSETSYYVRYRMAPVLQKYAHFDGRQQWADPDVLHAAELMREVYEAGQKPKMRSNLSEFVPIRVGERLKEVLAT